MKNRQLGNSELNVPILCFGANVFGWTVNNDEESFKLLDECMDAGLNFIDTADVYARWVPGNEGGESETLLGKWFASRRNRDRVILATKVGYDMGPGRQGLSRSRIFAGIDESLKRLKTDYIDLYQSHKDDLDTPVEETLSAFADLIKQGKVRVIGASNFSAERLIESLAFSREKGLPRYESLQPHYNLYDREDYEANLEPVCSSENVGVISYYSLASGFLSGKYRDKADLSQSVRGSRVERYLNDRGFRILNALDEVANETHSTPTSVALAWLLTKPSVTSPIVSATRKDQLSQVIAAAKLTLDQSAIQRLDEASKVEPVLTL